MSEPLVFLTPHQLVKRWNNLVSVGTLANWRSEKRGPDYQKIGNKVVYPLAKVVAWEQSNSFAVNDNAPAKQDSA